MEKTKQVPKRTNRRDFLKKLFDAQINTMKERGVSDKIVEAFLKKEIEVLNKARRMNYLWSHAPFIPVIPRKYLSLKRQMLLVRNGSDMRGLFVLEPRYVFDLADVPDELYYLYDVENGTEMLHKTPSYADESFKNRSRLGLTATEVIAVAVHTNIIPRDCDDDDPDRHYMFAIASRYKNIPHPDSCWRTCRTLPGLDIDKKCRPEMGWVRGDSTGKRWGAPSCKIRG